MATTIQVFMISSLFSPIKDVVHNMCAVKNLTGDVLVEYIRTVIKFIRKAGYHIVCLLTDGGTVNRKVYTLLGGQKNAFVENIPNPIYHAEKNIPSV